MMGERRGDEEPGWSRREGSEAWMEAWWSSAVKETRSGAKETRLVRGSGVEGAALAEEEPATSPTSPRETAEGRRELGCELKTLLLMLTWSSESHGVTLSWRPGYDMDTRSREGR